MPSAKDDATQALETIDTPHHEVHAGKHFFCSDIDASVDIASPKYWLITTPDTLQWAHFTLAFIFSTGQCTWELFENPDIAAAGVALSVFNSNRNSGVAATTAVEKDPTVNADGTRLKVYITGSGANPGMRSAGAQRSEEEIELKQNEQYLLKATVAGNGTGLTAEFGWYEHTDEA